MPIDLADPATDTLWLNDLADPSTRHGPASLEPAELDLARNWLKSMHRIRTAEETIAEMVISGEVRCPCHLAVGQEGVAVGVMSSLKPTDRVYGTHRSHAQFIALGGDLFGMFAEIRGRYEGTSRGMGGSMHLYQPDVGFHGSVPIVGATIPMAVGAALAAKMDGKNAIAVCFFGDGACEEGVLHESLNLAAVMKLPVLFVCENNLYSSHLDISLRQPSNSMARFAVAHSVPHQVVDGNDVPAVHRATQELVERIRMGEGPAFLEAVTFRWLGHVGGAKDIDVGVERNPEKLAAWMKRDPIQRLEAAIIGLTGGNGDEFRDMAEAERGLVMEAKTRSETASWPPESCLLDFVYSNTSKASAAQ